MTLKRIISPVSGQDVEIHQDSVCGGGIHYHNCIALAEVEKGRMQRCLKKEEMSESERGGWQGCWRRDEEEGWMADGEQARGSG